MLAFIHIEKAAGSTLRRILRRSFGPRHCEVEPLNRNADFFSAEDFRRLQKVYPRLRSISGHKVKPYSDLTQACPDVRYFTFLREPLACCASHYQYHQTWKPRMKNIPFEDWINRELYHNFQTKKIAGRADLNAAVEILSTQVEFIGLVEHFHESMVMLQKKFRKYRLEISFQSMNVAPSNAIKDDLLGDSRKKSMIQEANQTDVKLYSVAHELYQRQKEEYGESLEADVASLKNTPPPSFLNLNEVISALKRKLIYSPVLSYSRRVHGLLQQ